MSAKNIDLKREFDRVHEEMGQIIDNFPWTDPTAYASWLGQTYYYAEKSTRILALASAHFPLTENKFHARFIDHAREEKGHERLLINDLKGLNKELNQIPELPEMSAFYQCLYYWIEHINPVGIFGWVLCLEGLAVKRGPQLYEKVLKAHGPKATTFLKVHANEDVEHLATAFDLLNSLTEVQKTLILQNFEQCCALYGHVFEKIQKQMEKQFIKSKSA